MSFLYPAFLLGALAVAIPIVLHLLRRDVAAEIPFTAVRLLRRSPLEQTRRRTLRDWLLLVTRVAALLLLAAVFARPFITGTRADELLYVVAIDRSYSMGAETRFARALALAREVIDAAPRGSRVAVLSFDDRADVLAGPGSAAEARSALEGLQPGYGATRYAPVIARTLELSGSDAVQLDIIGDMQRSGWEGTGPLAAPARLRVRLHSTGLPPSNAAVTSVRRVDDGVLASIEQLGEGPPLSGRARLSLDGHQVAETPFAVAAGGFVEVLLRHALPASGAATVEIDDRDGFPADNVRHLVLDPSPAMRALVLAEEAAEGGFYLTRALEAADAGDAIAVRNAPPASLGRMSAEELTGLGAVVLLSTRGLDRRAREALARFVSGGGGLFVAATRHVDAAVLASIMGWGGFDAVEEEGGPVGLAVTDLRHPIFHPFGPLTANVGQVRFNRTWHVRGDGWDVAARFSSGRPALVERQQGTGRVLVFASDLDRRWNDFPLHPSFAIFVLESVRHVAARPVTPREHLVAEAPPGVDPAPGVFSLPADGRRVAVNVDLRERSPASITDDEFMAMMPSEAGHDVMAAGVSPAQIEARQSLWRYGMLLMLGMLLAESFIGRPR
jgi:hypothetical protein